jgi:hypothetical protein
MVVFMPRFARVVVPGIPHHITHRDNRRDDLFFLRTTNRTMFNPPSSREKIKEANKTCPCICLTSALTFDVNDLVRPVKFYLKKEEF